MVQRKPQVVARPDDDASGPSEAAATGVSRALVFKGISLAARLVIGGSLLYAGLLKVGHLSQSVVAVRAYQLPLPSWATATIGYLMPIVEIVLGLVIIAGLFTRWTALLGGVMMIAFIALIASAWARNLPMQDCGCFGPGGNPTGMTLPNEHPKYWLEILRDIGFLACAVWAVIFPKSLFSVDDWIAGPVKVEE